jgi:ABC-type multidrug transport system ATPase subunit
MPTRILLETSYGKALIDSLDLEESVKEDLRNYRNIGQPKVRRALAQQKAKVVMALLGLNGCADTIIGDAAHRGVSGGERRRVTLAEVLMGEYSIAAFDEISNGLDSAATFDIVRMIRASVDAFKYCCVISLNQPAPEVFELFDEVLVLKSGALVYQGPPDEAKDYFEGLGFHCPPKTDVADFLIRVTGPESRKWRASGDELVEAGLSASFVAWPRSTNEFVSRFRKSDAGKALFAEATRTMTAVEERQQRLASLSEDDSATINTLSNSSTTLWKENETRQFFNTWTTSFIICVQREVRTGC